MLCSSSVHVFTDLSDSNSTQSFLLSEGVPYFNFMIGDPVCYALLLCMYLLM